MCFAPNECVDEIIHDALPSFHWLTRFIDFLDILDQLPSLLQMILKELLPL
jgi:hypothetical protein